MLESSLIYIDSLTPSTNYLLKVTKYNSSEGVGIYDTTGYYFNICLLNLRMSLTNQLLEYTDQTSFFQQFDLAASGDILYPTLASEFTIDLDASPLTFLLEENVTLVGNYDLLSEPFDISAGGQTKHIVTSPKGTRFVSKRRGPKGDVATGTSPYMFIMSKESEIRNIRLQGAMTGFQDYNQDDLLCAGIKVDDVSTSLAGPFTISHCEIYNFSYAGVYVRAESDYLTINNCYIHHIKGAGGYTTPKGYGTWIQGSDDDAGSNFFIKNSIYDESKEGIDSQPNPCNINVDSCTFGTIFFNENINKHEYGEDGCTNCTYNHPDPNQPGCNYYSDHSPCVSVTTDNPYNIPSPGAGNSIITNSIFHQNAKNISLPYPANSKAAGNVPSNGVGIPLYNIKVKNNTFATDQSIPNEDECYYGGYARIDHNHIDACTWEYERTHNILHQYLGGTGTIPDPKPIIESGPNSFSYAPGSAVAGFAFPQPPEVNMAFDAIVEVQGFSPQHDPIPVYEQGDPIEVELSHGTVGNQSTNVTYVVQAKISQGAAVGSFNVSGNNAYNSNQVVSLPQSTNQTFDEVDFAWDTNKPGLFGIDAFSVDGNYSSTACSPYYASKMVHKPVIISPINNYMLIFNIKDSYFADLYQQTATTGVKKQVELNDVIIWQEDISEGGDDWERVEINMASAGFLTHLNDENYLNSLTFSIAIPDPTNVSTGGASGIKGVNVWVDDIYLKKVNSPQNLIRDGDVENSDASELPNEPSNICIWYTKNSMTFGGYHIDDSDFELDPMETCSTSSYAKGRAYLSSIDRKSGYKSIMLELPGINFDGDCSAGDYTIFSTPQPPQKQVISVAVDFDTRDFIRCNDFPTVFGFSTATPPSSGTLNSDHLIAQNISLTGNLDITGSNLLFQANTQPYTITVPNSTTLTITGNQAASTFLGGCQNMWGGIIVEPGGILIIDGFQTGGVTTNFVTIEDAEIGVLADGNGNGASQPEVDINHTTFNKNIVALQFEEDTYTTSLIAASLFKCDGGYISKDATVPVIYSNNHIFLDEASDLTIGGSGNISTVFQDVFIGILASNSDVMTAYCEFNDLKDNANLPNKGYGIIALNINRTPRTIDVLRGRFRNLYQGISSLGNYDVIIQNNDIDYFREMDNIAISLNSMNYPNDIEILQVKYFLNCNIGIKIVGSLLENVTLADNTFDNSAFSETSSASFHNTAITIQMPFAGYARLNTDVEIIGNKITDYRIGIHGSNIQQLKIIPNATSNLPNSVNFNLGATPTLTEEHIGIWLQNCPRSFIQGIYDPAATSPVADIKNNVTATGTDKFKGIDVTTSVNCRINCNFIENIPISMRFKERCIGTILRKNKMMEYDVAVYIDAAEIGPQKQVNSSGQDEPTNNEWHDTGGSVRVDGSTQSGLRFKWHRDPTSNTKFIPDPFNILVIELQDDVLSSVDCDDVSNRIGRDELFGKAVDDSLEFIDNINENNYLAKVDAFQAMINDTTIIYQSTSRDTAYINFYNAIRSTNIALFDSVYKLALDTATIGSAISLNASIADTNDLEYYRKSVNAIYLNTIAQNLPLDASDSSFCDEVSDLPYHVAGDAIFSAAAMIGKEIHPQSVSARIMNVENHPIVPETKTLVFNLVPNPANSRFVVHGNTEELKLIQILSSEGKIIKEFKIALNKDIPVEEFKPGIFYVKLTEKSGSSHFLKLVIIR